ncbi:olfactory receptor 6F1-like [Bombina bombina]|uniref:olfactory receptor 6F1-like n=1 Tax=Bombina bombina TaxID=8345 RepID=UPI00235A93F3|nr:olfactory receptor 6F1-like [Bombina bombina]XP_053575522.1 olfactory receptor 6F1-like [Bombina bombina]
MIKKNYTLVNEFLLLGFKDLHSFQIPFFLLLIAIYSITIVGNILIVALVSMSHQLHSPMYLFLSHLSLCDIFISTNVTPKTLQIILLGKSVISARDCIIQLYLFGAAGTIECCLLTVMSYDRYLAICRPLHYTTIMNVRLLHTLIIWSWMAGFVILLITYILVLELEFCGPNIIDHFFCDLAPLIELSCSDTSVVQIEVSIAAIVLSLFQFMFVIGTYICIFKGIFQITSTSGRQKVFSTCSSHLSVVCTYYGTMITLYVAPSKGVSMNFNKVLSLLNTVVTPMFNPIIYSLRNKEIREAMSKCILVIMALKVNYIEEQGKKHL